MRRALLGIALLVVLAAGSAWLLDASIDRREEAQAVSLEGRARLASVTSWGYQLQNLDIAKAAASPYDLIVVDEGLDGRRQGSASGQLLARLKRKPDGQSRIVLSYLSIGEAEEYRRYWRSGWVAPGLTTGGITRLTEVAAVGAAPAKAQLRLATDDAVRPLLQPTSSAPAWLGPENAEWRGNYEVRFWHPEWKAMMFGSPDAALDRVIAAGFDGIYIDRADVYSVWRREHPTAQADMVAFIAEIAAYARQMKPGFVIVMQNAEELLSVQRLRDALDGVAKEDLLYGLKGEARENGAQDIQSSLGLLRLARNDGIPVLVVEYVGDPESVTSARKRIESEGFIPYFGSRSLATLHGAH